MLCLAPEVVEVESLIANYHKIINNIDDLEKILCNNDNENLKRELEILNHQKGIIEMYLIPENVDQEIIFRKTLNNAIENVFLYYILHSKDINELRIYIEKHDIPIPSSNFKKALNFLKGKEKKIIEKCLKYEKYFHKWDDNKYEIIEDFHWLFDSKESFEQYIDEEAYYIKFEDICQVLRIEPNNIRRCFKKLISMKTNEIIEKYENFCSKTWEIKKPQEKMEEEIGRASCRERVCHRV